MYFFFFNDTATTEIYTLSLHDALPILRLAVSRSRPPALVTDLAERLGAELVAMGSAGVKTMSVVRGQRSEEHTSELQSRQYLVCRLLLEKKQTLKLDLENVDRFYTYSN